MRSLILSLFFSLLSYVVVGVVTVSFANFPSQIRQSRRLIFKLVRRGRLDTEGETNSLVMEISAMFFLCKRRGLLFLLFFLLCLLSSPRQRFLPEKFVVRTFLLRATLKDFQRRQRAPRMFEWMEITAESRSWKPPVGKVLCNSHL